MNEYILAGVALLTLVASTLALYTAVYSYKQAKERKAKVEKRYQAYKRSRRAKAMKERLELFDCYLLTLGVR